MILNHQGIQVIVATTLILSSLCVSQKCLESPPELELSPEIDSNGNIVYHGTLIYDAKRFNNKDTGYPTSFTTRVHNGNFPSPTIRMIQDAIYNITLINKLGVNDPNDPAIMNEFHSPNTTNIHTHGLHVGGDEPSDDVFVSVKPGKSYQYSYYIPCNHHGGTNWYHPHHHGMFN